MENSNGDSHDRAEQESENPNAARREALTKMGLFAAYTAPLLLGMMTSAKAQVASGIVGIPDDSC